MEAANLGAFLGTCNDAALPAVIDIIKTVPSYSQDTEGCRHSRCWNRRKSSGSQARQPLN